MCLYLQVGGRDGKVILSDINKCGVCQATVTDEASSMKDWILRYAEQSSDDEEEEEEEAPKSVRNPELDEKFDPVSRIEASRDEMYFGYC